MKDGQYEQGDYVQIISFGLGERGFPHGHLAIVRGHAEFDGSVVIAGNDDKDEYVDPEQVALAKPVDMFFAWQRERRDRLAAQTKLQAMRDTWKRWIELLA